MALAAATVWEIRTAGDDANGGGFVTGATGSDWSQQNGKRTGADVTDISTTDAVANGTTTITSATANFATTIVGNIICLSGGTGGLTKGWYQVITRTNSTTITVDRTVAAGTGITMNIGGALLSLGMCGGAGIVTGNKIWIKAGTYSITSATTNISGGCFTTATAGVVIEGYNATRGDFGTKPLLQASGIATFVIITNNQNAAHMVSNLKLDGASLVSSKGLSIRQRAYKCEFVNFTNGAMTGNLTQSTAIECSATGCSTLPAFENLHCYACTAFNNTTVGFNFTQEHSVINCISDSNSGATTDGFVASGASSVNATFINCVSYNNGRDGFRITGARGGFIINCIAEDNAGWGFDIVNVNQVQLVNCAGFSNASGEVNVGTGYDVNNYNFVTGTSSFFTDAAGQDFSLNNTAGGGADVREGGIPSQFAGMSTTQAFLDVGAVQHQGAASGGGAFSAAYVG